MSRLRIWDSMDLFGHDDAFCLDLCGRHRHLGMRTNSWTELVQLGVERVRFLGHQVKGERCSI